jgi:hypothetical protein
MLTLLSFFAGFYVGFLAAGLLAAASRVPPSPRHAAGRLLNDDR